MNRMDPPPVAKWMLEHCIPGQGDQALAGDLMEEFQGGRTSGWYWRQVLAACVVGWARYLGGRAPLIVFAALWSMLAPGWTAMIDRIQNRDVAWPLAVGFWLALNVGFLWFGMLLFVGLHRRAVIAQHARKLKRAFFLAAVVFLPVYFATVVLSNLFAWPGLAVDLRTMSPLGEIVDFHAWADALRLPFFATMLASMWPVAPVLGARPVPVLEWGSRRTGSASHVPGPVVERDAGAVRRMLAFVVGTGLLNALIAGFVLCRLPDAHHPSVASVLARATVYVAIGALAGIMGSYVYWHSPASAFRDDPPLPFGLFAMVCVAGWVWVPAMVLFSEQVSALSAGVAMIGAFVLSGEIHRIVALTLPPAQRHDPLEPATEQALFTDVLYRAPAEPDGYLLALSLYGAGWAIASRSNMTAATLLAMAACLFMLRRTVLPGGSFDEPREYRRAALRVAAVMLPAILVTFWALLEGVAHRNHLGQVGGSGAGVVKASDEQRKNESAHVGNGYESVILWTYPPKKQIVAPVQPAALFAPGTRQPVVIRFNGEYWYLQPPDVRPGPHAHKAVGSPADLHIASTNSFPLMMEAHQYLRSPVRVARCRELRVQIEDRESATEEIAMAVWLKNSANAAGPAVYLGQQPIPATGSQTLTFAVPAAARMSRFDEITVLMLPDSGHRRIGPRIAVEQFELVPR